MLQWISTAVAVVALGLSAWVWNEQRRGMRRAFVEARVETYRQPWIGSDGAETTRIKQDHRLVLINHGPAIAEQINVRFLAEDGSEQSLRPMVTLPVPALHPGRDVHSQLIIPWGEFTHEAEVSWTDRRRGRQTVRMLVPSRTVLRGGA